jgi:hypothetical protein
MQALLLTAFFVLLLPLCGTAAAGADLSSLLGFPPLPPNAPLSVSDIAVLSVFLFVLPFILLPLIRLLSYQPHSTAASIPPAKFPSSLKFGILLCLLSWILAWSRLELFRPLQLHTFLPLWLSYILLVNGLVKTRTGTSPWERWGTRYLLLFPCSAIYWWLFEYLNRYVQNWSYLSVESFSAAQYIFLSTTSFATVLPAVFGTRLLLSSYGRWNAPLENWVRLRIWQRPGWWFFAGAFPLIFLAKATDFLFPFVWLSPLCLLIGFKIFLSQPSFVRAAEDGDWRGIIQWAAAALLCGFFWEMWNFFSLAKWQYHIPLVGVGKIFEMPVLGYAGYLPFGLLCGMIVETLLPASPSGDNPPIR